LLEFKGFSLSSFAVGVFVYAMIGALSSVDSVFVVVSSTGVTGGFRLRGYAGGSGRLDVIARCVMVVQLYSGSGLLGVLLGPPSPPKVLVVRAWECPSFRSERQVMVEIAKALTRGSSGCMEVLDVSFERLVHVLNVSGFRHVLLAEDGVNAFKNSYLVAGRIAFYLGSQIDMPRWAEDVVKRYGAVRVSLGPRSVHSEHVILTILSLRDPSISTAASSHPHSL
jgi:tRNA pseudouridine-54 N-methylase